MIHPTAIIDDGAKLGADVCVGAYSIIGPHVEIGEGTNIGSHVVINGPTMIGKNNRIYQFASIGEVPQDLKYKGEHTTLEMGDNNIIREFVTLNRGTVQGGGATKIGNRNLFMAYVHIAHDCIVGNQVIFANNASLAGHVIVDDFATISAFSMVRQFTRIGQYSFVAGASGVGKDVLPFTLVSGVPARARGLNLVGLKRRGFSAEQLLQLRRAYKAIYRQGLTTEEAIAFLETMVPNFSDIQLLIDGIRGAERGIAR